MSAFIKLNKQDAFITPYTAHKSYSYTTNQERIIAGIRFRLGNALSSSRSGDIIPTNLNRFHSSVNQLYYSNYTSSIESGSFENYNQSTLFFTKSLGDNVAIISIPQFLFGENIKPGTFEFNSGSVFHIVDDGEGNLFASGAVSYSATISSSVSSSNQSFTSTDTSTIESISSPSEINFVLETEVPNNYTVTTASYSGANGTSPFYINNGTTQVTFVTGSQAEVLAVRADQIRIISNNTSRTRFIDTSTSGTITITATSSSIQTTTTNYEIHPASTITDNELIGNIYYSHGMLTLTKSDIAKRFQEQVLRSGSLSWKGSHTIYEHTYNCRSNQSQLNFTLNPSSYNNTTASGSVNDNITGSYFQPYVTTVGLYNDANELIAVGKLGQPIPKSQHSDMTFAIKFDA